MSYCFRRIYRIMLSPIGYRTSRFTQNTVWIFHFSTTYFALDKTNLNTNIIQRGESTFM